MDDPIVNLQSDPAVDLQADAAEPVFQNLYDLSDEEKADILKEQNDRLRASLRYMTDLYPSMIKNYKKYRSIADPLRDDLGREITNRANIFVPYPHAIVESAMPRLSGRLPRVHAFPRQNPEAAKVEAIQDLIIYSLDRMGFLRLQQLWIRQFEIYGWSPLVFFWKNEDRECFERQRDPVTGALKMIKKSKTVWDDFGARVIDVFDSFIQPGVEEIECGDWFQFREWMSKKDIKARVDGGVFYPEVMDYIADNPSSSGTLGRENDTRNDRDDLTGLVKDFQKHSFGRYEVIYTLENGRIIIMIDGKVLARVGDNPNPLQEKAIINLNLLQQINEPIGVSTIEALGGLPEKLNVLTNSRLDNLSLLMNKVILADKFSNTDWDTVRFEAGNIILTDDIESSIKVLEVPDIAISSEREILTTKEEMQFTSAISDYIVGVKSGSRISDTATGVSSIIREANAKFALKLAAFEAYALRRLVESVHAYNMMYMPEEKRIHILGPKGYVVKDIKLDEILCECDFLIEPGSSSPLDQLTRRESLMHLLDKVIQLPQVVDITKFMKEVFDANDIRNPEDMLLQLHNAAIPEAQDAELAQAENIALLQGQDVELMGNDQLHIQIHSRAMSETADPEGQAAISAHLQAHMAKAQAAIAPALAAGRGTIFGGPNANTSQSSNGPVGGAPTGQPEPAGAATTGTGPNSQPPNGAPSAGAFGQ